MSAKLLKSEYGASLQVAQPFLAVHTALFAVEASTGPPAADACATAARSVKGARQAGVSGV